jgi:chromosome partitioning protein
MHLATALARMGHRVGGLDLDLRQKTFGQYVSNRLRYAAQINITLQSPNYIELPETAEADLNPGEHLADRRLSSAIEMLEPQSDFILIDCPGSHTRLSQMAHAMANTLITPLNDSFVDFDLLAKIESDGVTVRGPSVYSEMVWSARQLRAQAGLTPLDWIVVRNRLGTQNMINKQKMADAIAILAKRIGFRIAPGFGERVVFRELFPRGLTLLDLKDLGINQLSMSNIAARQELRELVKALNLPNVSIAF